MRCLVTVLIAVLALAMAACGSTDPFVTPLSRSAYERRTAQIDARLRTQFERGAAIAESARRPVQAADGYEIWSSAFATAATSVNALACPRELTSAQQELADGLRGLSGELHDAAQEIHAGHAAAARRIIARLAYSAAASTVRQATAAMRERGYAVFVAQ